MRALALSLLVAPVLGGCGMTARAGCFPADTALPDHDLLTRSQVGASARDLAEALLAGDAARAQALLTRDPALARVTLDSRHDMLMVAVAGCSADAVDAVLRAGAPADGVADKGYPLRLALHADDPALAARLLAGGASPTPAGAPLAPFREAIVRNSAGAVTMLLDARGDPNVTGPAGKRPLHVALDSDRFRLAELLLSRGADPFAIDVTGGNLATSVATPMLTDSREDAAAQKRLRDRLPALGWPEPAPSPARVRELALAGKWPPAGAKGAGPVSRALLSAISANAGEHASLQ